MARGLNHVILFGALARDPELRYTPSGMAVLDMVVAGDDHIIGNDGQPRVLPWYHRTSLLGKQAEGLADGLKAGDAVMVDGSLEYRTWETPEGAKRSQVSVKALRVDAGLFGARDEMHTRDSQGGYRLTNAINAVTIVGNLTRDADLRYTPAGDAVSTINLAINESWKDKAGDWQQKAHFVDVNAWRELAELGGQFKKGDPILVMGRLINESWTDKDGNKRNSTRVEAHKLEGLLRKPASEGLETTNVTSERKPPQRPAQSRGQEPELPAEEDLPF